MVLVITLRLKLLHDPLDLDLYLARVLVVTGQRGTELLGPTIYTDERSIDLGETCTISQKRDLPLD